MIIGVFTVFDEKMFGRITEIILPALNRIFFFHLMTVHFPLLELPRCFVHRGIVLDVFDFPSSLQHKCFQSFLGEFFGCPSTGHS